MFKPTEQDYKDIDRLRKTIYQRFYISRKTNKELNCAGILKNLLEDINFLKTNILLLEDRKEYDKYYSAIKIAYRQTIRS